MLNKYNKDEKWLTEFISMLTIGNFNFSVNQILHGTFKDLDGIGHDRRPRCDLLILDEAAIDPIAVILAQQKIKERNLVKYKLLNLPLYLIYNEESAKKVLKELHWIRDSDRAAVGG